MHGCRAGSKVGTEPKVTDAADYINVSFLSAWLAYTPNGLFLGVK
jgi:hypothetical protein